MKSINSIVLTDPHRATIAGEWCKRNLRPAEWRLNAHHLFSSTPKYEFGFFDTKHAVEFALRFV